ncbi:hypothetical protein J6590_004803 [Homalodisca vitripennis]|nr:hypothetical protein J6590_004803 [Homalodisca vitripennis]
MLIGSSYLEITDVPIQAPSARTIKSSTVTVKSPERWNWASSVLPLSIIDYGTPNVLVGRGDIDESDSFTYIHQIRFWCMTTKSGRR